MRKKQVSPFEKDTWKRVDADPEFAEAFFEELVERPLAVQVSMLRRMRGISQVQLAASLNVTQSFLSKLEKEGSDHLVSLYEKLAKLLKGRLAIIPKGSRIITPRRQSRLPRAA
jgi:DNA-binding XRE family transcriptional regulator